MAIPAYHHTFVTLQDEILAGTWQPGSRLPSEAELCRRFAISRITIRHAMRLLEEKGLVVRQRGSGTFVRGGMPEKIAILTHDFAGSLDLTAPDMSRALLGSGQKAAPAWIAETLDVEPDSPIFHAERIDRRGELPVACDHVWMMLSHADIITGEMLESLRFLERWLSGKSFVHCGTNEIVEAIPADAHLAELWNVAPGTPVLRQIDIVLAENDTPIAVFDSYYRGDMFRLMTTIATPRADA